MPPKRLRVLLSFTREPDESVVQTTRDAIAGLKDNNYFPHPPADPATLEAKLGEFIEAITAANQDGKRDKIFKDKKREQPLVLLRQGAMYVQPLRRRHRRRHGGSAPPRRQRAPRGCPRCPVGSVRSRR